MTIIENYNGGPVGLKTLAVAVGEDAGTVEEIYEPYLIQQGFLDRTAQGRKTTLKAYRHFKITPQEQQMDLFAHVNDQD
jgi:Holliday junction DNA helicase RuvB